MKLMAQAAGRYRKRYPIGDMACALLVPWAEHFHVAPASRQGFQAPAVGGGHERIMNLARLYEGLSVSDTLAGLDSGCHGLGVPVADTLKYEDAEGPMRDVRAWEGFFPSDVARRPPQLPRLGSGGGTGRRGISRRPGCPLPPRGV